MWLVYRKLRPAVGIPVAFVIISGAFLGSVNIHLILVALGFMFIDLFGNFYNDYTDYAEDVRNERKDKFTTLGLISRNTALHISIILAFAGFAFLYGAGSMPLALGILLAFLLFLYSNRLVRLKGKLIGYAMSFPYFILPLLIAYNAGKPVIDFLPLAFFFYFQCIYILCQKDSTDTKDDGNLFINTGWAKSFAITCIFAAASLLSLFYLSFLYPVVLLAFILNLAAKTGNLYHIGRRSITRKQRSNYMLADFISHYLIAAGMIFL